MLDNFYKSDNILYNKSECLPDDALLREETEVIRRPDPFCGFCEGAPGNIFFH